MLTFWTENMVKAEVEGYSFCRLVGEMTWALRDAPGRGAPGRLRVRAEPGHLSYPVIVLCLYDLDRFSGEVVVNIVKTHPQVLVQGILVENPYYVGPDEFLSSAQRLIRPAMTAEHDDRRATARTAAAVLPLPRARTTPPRRTCASGWASSGRCW